METLTKADFEEVWKIMEESFPTDERRNRKEQEKLLAESCYHLYGCRQQGRLAAFLAVWEFEEFSFVEHFAVEKNCRNGGLGAELLGQLLTLTKTPAVLEVELPESELARRRIGFYERNGFVLNPYDDYVQPPLSDMGGELPLLIMTYPNGIARAEYEQIRETLYRYVYKVENW